MSAPEPSSFRRLLVAVDGSNAAAAAASFAIRLAGTAASDVTLLHVCPDLRSAEHAPPLADPTAFRVAAEHRVEETAEWQRRLKAFEDQAAVGTRVQSRVVRGRTAPALLEAAAELDSDVILVGSRGRGSVRARLLGSVSSQVVDHAHCSVMVFPDGAETSPPQVASVVIGVDGSPGSARAVTAGATLATALDARLVLLAAYESGIPLELPTTDLRAELRRHAVGALDAARSSVTADVDVAEEMVEGEAREALVEAAERLEPSVLVVGTRGLGGFKGLLLGSTSRWVVHHASCPVLVVRSQS